MMHLHDFACLDVSAFLSKAMTSTILSYSVCAPMTLISGVRLIDTLQVLLLADVDFLVSAGLHERLSEPTANEALVQDTTTHRQVIVLPAFETDPKMTIAEGSDSADRAINSAHQC